MNSSPNNYVTVNHILSDVLRVVDDSDYRWNSKGYYTSLIQQALSELAFDTHFDQRSASLDITSNLRIDMPKGAFNIKDMWLYSGDECNFDTAVNVYYKEDFINSGSGNTYASKNMGQNGEDPFFRDSLGSKNPTNVYHYSIQNGMIMLSSNARKYQKVLIRYSGVGTDIGEVPFIPIFLRQAVKDWVTVEALQVKVARVSNNDFNRWMTILSIHKDSLGDDTDYRGSWYDAQVRVRRMDDKERRDYKEYCQKMYF